ncbi:type B DNA-directed DNA polymerase [Halobaculum rubrum]|uniref:type B DNA-directed DNA polymerase n=1 Tax=Halobaculum rubrum TaxID=2872158 RepID=UPI001CA3B8F8|nr:type B DNA-directed DNA polymerase [Halobaculum rubrum]QZX99808.1 type B DNA-directed DNA polymerase [Halobaculum rubrum]QZX99845.1 type B DNA-directed DNA polymerase [Halobaculum rubrum]
MVLAIDYDNDSVTEWRLTADGVERTVVDDYRPTLFVGSPVSELYGRDGGPNPEPKLARRGAIPESLRDLRSFLDGQDAVADLTIDVWRQTFRSSARPVLRVDCRRIEDIRSVARRIHQFGDPDAYTCYNVDLTRQLRYTLETDTEAAPDTSIRDLRTLRIQFPAHESDHSALSQLRVNGEQVGSSPREVVEAVEQRVSSVDPDVLIVDTARVVPLLFEAAAEYGLEPYSLGREFGYTQLASESTYTSYGKVGHSPARYSVPGRVILDRANTFFYGESGLDGCLDLVERAGLPLQELGWASIGRVLTAMQIREARSRGVLVPWRAWRPEFFRSASTLDTADRGGTTLAPEVGVHEDVHELDFASMYPNIIREYNISPETVRCGCCDNDAVPKIGYSICERDGYLPDVLGPLIDGRSDIKRRIRETNDPDERATLEARSSAIKWILVSCFGYQGFSNAKFGRIECHESINAFAREILLDAKAALEEGGWRVLHGIVDSIWVTPAPEVAESDRRSLDDIAAEVSGETQIELEYEGAFDWVAFCPRRGGDGGALTRYFGRRRGVEYPDDGLGDAVKTRGIESRQDDTPAWIAQLQSTLIRTLDRTHDVEAVVSKLASALGRLEREELPPTDLLITQRVSKRAEQYRHETVTVAALKRAKWKNCALAPGQRVEYLVFDDAAHGLGRVRLSHEELRSYDTGWYRKQAIRAAESVLSPLGWDRERIRRSLSGYSDSRLSAYE